MAEKVKTYSIFNVLALLAISVPLLLSFVNGDRRPNLVGQVISDEKPEFNSQDWFDGTYQSAAEEYNSDHWVFKEKMVRLNNQFYYDAFNQIRVNGFVMGKENYIFSESYIFSAYGDDLVKEEKIVNQLKKARLVQDSLKKKGIDLILGFAPGKGKYFTEYIEDKYKHEVKTTNHDLYIKNARANDLNVLDLYTDFMQMKDTSRYPLFTRFGHHWSYYGECIASKKIIKYIEALHKTDLPDIRWDSIDVVDTARSRDADVLKSMNLYRNPPQDMKLAYPDVSFEEAPEKNRTKVLVIGDSYWYGPAFLGLPQNSFAGGEFWYYYNKVAPPREAGVKLEVWELDLKKEIEANQVIMLMYSDGNLASYANSFIDDAYELYTSPKTFYTRKERSKQILMYSKQIRESPILLKKATKKSNDLQIPLDSAIKLDAMRMTGVF